MTLDLPVYDVDLFSDDAIADPHPHYAAIRELGPVVRLPARDSLEVLAVGRYADIKKALLDHRNLSSASGVNFNEIANEVAKGTSLGSDEPLHTKLRKVSSAPLLPNALAEIRGQIARAADDLIASLVQKKRFDGIADLAHHLPVSIVSNLVGLPEDGRENMMEWSAAIFNCSGNMNERFTAAIPKLKEMFSYIVEQAGPDQVKPGSWASWIYKAADEGLIERDQAPALLLDYVGPSLDTTIFATGHLLYFLGTHPDQWQILRDDPALIGQAIDETLRLEAPIRAFTRLAINDIDVGGVTVPAGSWIGLFYGSANRDGAKWEKPDSFDITRRNSSEHLSFGKGRHVCAGQHLAKLEMTCLLESMVRRVKTFTVGEPEIELSNTLRGYGKLPIEMVA